MQTMPMFTMHMLICTKHQLCTMRFPLPCIHKYESCTRWPGTPCTKHCAPCTLHLAQCPPSQVCHNDTMCVYTMHHAHICQQNMVLLFHKTISLHHAHPPCPCTPCTMQYAPCTLSHAFKNMSHAPCTMLMHYTDALCIY